MVVDEDTRIDGASEGFSSAASSSSGSGGGSGGGDDMPLVDGSCRSVVVNEARGLRQRPAPKPVNERKVWIERARALLSREGATRFEAGLELVANQVARLERIAEAGEDRYLNGKVVKVIQLDDGEVREVRGYDPDDARVAIAASDAIGKRLPIFVPDKVALTDPTGAESYDGSAAILAARIAKDVKDGKLPSKPDFGE